MGLIGAGKYDHIVQLPSHFGTGSEAGRAIYLGTHFKHRTFSQ